MAQEKNKSECKPENKSESTNSSKEKSNTTDSSKFKGKKDRNYQTKVVIRRLPPTMTEDQFLHQIAPVPENDYFYFVKGDLSLGMNSFSRAYINFLHSDDIFIFKEKFDNYVFLDLKGTEYPAVVEFAPFQKIPKKKSKKKDAKCGTIEQDPDYLKFLEKMNKKEDPFLLPPEFCLEAIEAREKELKANNGAAKLTTPLIEFLKQKKVEQQKQREEKREERKRRELERKRIREEVRRKKKDKEKPPPKERKDSDKETEEAPSTVPTPAAAEEVPLENVTVLKNPEREKEREKEPPSVPKTQPEATSTCTETSSTSNAEYKSLFKTASATKSWSKYRESEKSEAHSNRFFSRKKAAENSKSLPNTDDHLTTDETKKESSLPNPPEMTKEDDLQERLPLAEEIKSHKLEDDEEEEEDDSKGKDPRSERRIRNKDRPSLEIYRPGMRRLGTHRSSPQKEVSTSASNSSTPSPTPASKASPLEWST